MRIKKWKEVKKESELDGNGQWHDKKVTYEPKKWFSSDAFSKIIGSFVAPLALLISFYSVYSTSTDKKIKLELNSQFSKNLIDEQWRIHKTAKDKVAEILSAKSHDTISQLLLELNYNITVDVYSTNDTSIINCFDKIRHWLDIFNLVEEIRDRTLDIELYRNPIILFEESGTLRRMPKLKDSHDAINSIKQIQFAIEKLEFNEDIISQYNSSFYKEMMEHLKLTIKSYNNNDTIINTPQKRIDLAMKVGLYRNTIFQHILQMNHQLTNKFSKAHQKIINTTFD